MRSRNDVLSDLGSLSVILFAGVGVSLLWVSRWGVTFSLICFFLLGLGVVGLGVTPCLTPSTFLRHGVLGGENLE